MEYRSGSARTGIQSPRTIPRLAHSAPSSQKPSHVALQGKFAVLQQSWTPAQMMIETPTISSANKRASSAPTKRSASIYSKAQVSSRPSSGFIRPNLRPSFYRFDNVKNTEEIPDSMTMRVPDDLEVNPDFRLYRVGLPPTPSGASQFGSMASLGYTDRSRPPTARSIGKPMPGSSGSFRSPAIAMEVALYEKLRDLDARPQGPCPIRLQAYREVFDDIIDKEPYVGYILRQIKHEYDISGVQIQDGGLQTMYDELVQMHAQLKQEYEKLSQDHGHENIYSKKLEEENEEMKAMLASKEREIYELKESLASTDPLWQNRLALQERIEDMVVRETSNILFHYFLNYTCADLNFPLLVVIISTLCQSAFF
eukprot:TRINITY_DN3549_c0_g1_i3.p1 TRINITY_DN3549_c0_g1~~TRINITY_DN3549_c0_g1_i3.p1  ORF type:complete len:368 (+),score=81.72 TRINITY_DN3549_c0_g1_i3:43-1146(+)